MELAVVMSESSKSESEIPENIVWNVNDVTTEEHRDENSTDECEFVEKVQLQQLILYGLRDAECGKELQSLQSIIFPDASYLQSSCWLVRHDLFLHLRPLDPIRVELFGSTITRTAFKGSDLDFYIQLKHPMSDVRRLLNQAAEHLGMSTFFRHFRVLARPRIPLLKCVHVPTGFKCDLNFTNEVGVHNSHIMRLLITKDPRIYDIAMMTKCWLKAHGFIGHRTMTSYGALWLLFFYLQQVVPPILQPFSVYQTYVAPFYIQSANIVFDYNMYLADRTYNQQLALHLFKGFFQFYANFNFESSIICPYLGRALSKNNFIETLANNFPAHGNFFNLNPLQQGKLLKPICIQDPFELCRTIPGKVNRRYFYNFRYAIANAAKICSDTRYVTSKDFLLALFNSDVTIPRHQLHASMNYPQIHRLSFQLTPSPREKEIIQEMCSRFPNIYHIQNHQLIWAQYSIEFLMAIFEEIFRFAIVGPWFHNYNHLSKIFFVTGEYNVVSKRIPYRRDYATFLEKEIKCSQQISQKLTDKLYAEVHVYADPANFEMIHVDFRNLNTSVFNAFMSKRIRDYKLAYFEKRLRDTIRVVVPSTSTLASTTSSV